MTDLKVIEGGILAATGFQSAAVQCGIKTDALDLALIVADEPANVAAVFTTNKATAAPVIVCREHLKQSGGIGRAIAVNSGCANACTGQAGMSSAKEMAKVTAQSVGCPVDQALIASTGVIGLNLDLAKVTSGITHAVKALGRNNSRAAAEAIMTTDPWPKESAIQVTCARGTFSVGGMVKGSGMIEPMMATMLAFLTTDAAIAPDLLQRALTEVTDDTFNAITVDGECSTNDSVFLLASGRSGVTITDELYPSFVKGLREVCSTLARDVVRGGEGATKLVSVTVTGAQNSKEASRAARAIANSPLVKTALHGADPNWGRLVAVAGRAGVDFDLSRSLVQIGETVLFENNSVHPDREPEASEHLKGTEVSVRIDLGVKGLGEATIWTCDLTAEYVHINADYRT